MSEKKAVVTFSQEDIIKIKEIILDSEKEEALKMLKTIIKRIEESQNKTLKVGI